MNAIQFYGAIELGLIFGLVAWGVYFSLRVLQFPDLTIDGSFPLGAGVAAILIVNGVDPWLASLLATFAGGCAGFVTAWLSIKWNILNLLAGILTMTALMSINLRIMQGPNIALFQQRSIFSYWIENGISAQTAILSICGILIFLLWIGLYKFLTSHIGLAMRAAGCNLRMAQAQGIETNRIILWGMVLSNALVAFSGALYAQSQGFADVSMGIGTMIIGLAAVIIGEALLPSRHLLVVLLRCLIGSIVYRLMITFSLNMDFLGMQASDLNLVTAILVGLAMSFPRLRVYITNQLKKERGPL
ncbi:MAG: transporter permease [Chlamydiales bacterium]|jgi:putative ABC transport system permease protein|nr:transporter permease [Chlamydiales bacterium]